MVALDDTALMHYALRLAQRGLGRTAENPTVGCVIVKDGRMVGQGWTQPGGRPHAETEALASAGSLANGATAYVTLEPCAHHGRTPPCTEALIQAGIRRVVIGCTDTDPRVSGQGIARLQHAGMELVAGVCEAEARQLNAGFFRRLSEGLPEISVKIATSLDEKITTGDPANPWITNTHSRAYGHLLRAQHQAIVTGIGTVLADDPRLTCRLPGLEDASPVRVVLDRQLRLPEDAALIRTAPEVPLWIITSPEQVKSQKATRLEELGVTLFALNEEDFTSAMHLLAERGIHRVLIEGGQALTTAALASGVANHLYWFQAPHTIGNAGLPALTDWQSLMCWQSQEDAHTARLPLGEDVLWHTNFNLDT